MAADWALNPETAGIWGKEAAQLAEKLYVSGNIFRDKKLLDSLQELPGSCQESARILKEKRGLYERDLVFPSSIIEYVARMLEEEGDNNLREQLRLLSGRRKTGPGPTDNA